MPKCIVCLTDKELNTHMRVDIDEESYEVYLCDKHAETTTMGTVKSKVQEICDKLRYAVQLAKDLGIDIPEIHLKSDEKITKEFDILPKENADLPPKDISKPPSGHQSTPPSTPPSNPQLTNSNVIKRNAKPIKLSENAEINCDTEIETQKVKIRGGVIDVLKRSKGDAGATDVQIINTKDETLQTRTKMLVQAGRQGTLRQGYSSSCLACQGNGIHPITQKTCPKCGGTGMAVI